jgi:hypothetical protein
MSKMTEEMKNDLKWAMRSYLVEACSNNKLLTESDQTIQKKFVKEEATYEQLLNLCFNRKSEERYLDSTVLEMAAIVGLDNLVTVIENSPVKKSGRAISLFESTAQVVHEDYAKAVGADWKNMPGHATALDKAKAAGKVGYEATKKAGKAAYEKGKESAEKALKEIKEAGTKAREWFNKLTPKQKAIGGAIVGGGIVLGVLATWLYKRYFSAAAQACKGKTGDEFHKCIKDYKIKAINQTISTLKSKKTSCKSSKHPDKCNASIEKEIKRWESKLAKLKK